MEMKPLAWSKLGAHFADADKAREYLEYLRWGNSGPCCPHCGAVNPYKIEKGVGSSTRKGLYKCREKECRKQFTVTVGTVFEDSHIPINKWLQALYLIGASKKGISAHQLHRMMGVTYRSAWFVMHRLRYAMSVEPLVKMTGTVEVDETYVGGRRRGTKRGRPQPGSHKTSVVALVERGGNVKAMPMERITIDSLGKAMRETLASHATIPLQHPQAVRQGTSCGYRGGRRRQAADLQAASRNERVGNVKCLRVGRGIPARER